LDKFIADLIKRGGGNGPMKPGNRLIKHGAKSCRVYALKDKKGREKPLLLERFFS
jgi:hypothetical protein